MPPLAPRNSPYFTPRVPAGSDLPWNSSGAKADVLRRGYPTACAHQRHFAFVFVAVDAAAARRVDAFDEVTHVIDLQGRTAVFRDGGTLELSFLLCRFKNRRGIEEADCVADFVVGDGIEVVGGLFRIGGLPVVGVVHAQHPAFGVEVSLR